MVVDASAIIAVLAEEPAASVVAAAIDDNPGPFAVSPLTVFEAALGLARARATRNQATSRRDIENALSAVEKFLEIVGAEEVSASRDLGRRAIAAAARFGRAVGHPADLSHPPAVDELGGVDGGKRALQRSRYSIDRM